MIWKAEAEFLRFDQNKSWREIVEKMRGQFPALTDEKIKNKIRTYIRQTPRYKAERKKDRGLPNDRSFSINLDGTRKYEIIQQVENGKDLTPEDVMEIHGLDNKVWEIVSFRVNYWNTQGSENEIHTMAQSKLTVRPLKPGELTFAAEKEWFESFNSKYKPKRVNLLRQPEEGHLLEVNIADPHFGKLSWAGESGENYDYKIATKRHNKVIDDFYNRARDRSIEKIIYPVGGDFFNSDTPTNTTTKGTHQDNDLRWRKMYELGKELVISSVDKLADIAPVEVFYVAGNHDEQITFYLLHMLDAFFRNDKNIKVVTNSTPRYYVEWHNNLIGFTHGDEGKKRIGQVMQVEAREAWGRTQYHEMHAEHLHKEMVVDEDGGVIMRRMTTFCGADYWHVKNGYVGNVKKAQAFLYKQQTGLFEIWNSTV
jgi:hypothetical protein